MTRNIVIDPRRPATPMRLARNSAGWELEVVRWGTTDRKVWQPESAKIMGRTKILECLREHGNHELASAALELMGLPDDGVFLVFDIADGRWRPTQPSLPPPAASQSEVAELRTQLLLLRGLHDSLRERVAALEATVHGVVARVSMVPPRRGVVRRHDASGKHASEAPAAAKGAAPGAPLAAKSRNSAPPKQAPAGAPRSPAAPAPAAAAAAPHGPGKGAELPTRDDVNACLQQLMGTNVTLGFGKADAPLDPDERFGSALVSDSGELVGSIETDARGAAELGGLLLGLPSDVIAEQAEGDISEDVSGALAEICNNLAGIMNRNTASTHVRTVPLSPDHAVVPRKRLDLASTSGGILRVFVI